MSNDVVFFESTGCHLPPEYALIRLLGTGAMAHVFLARQTALKRLVAIKVLRSELAADPVGRKRFIREAQAAARIEHPSVTSIFRIGSLENEVPFLEMQYIDGVNLADHLQAFGPLDAQATRSILEQLAAALAAAHECHVIHRNLEPANVLIESETGRVFLSDFGIAGILESGSEIVTKLTREGDRLGSPKYMSPEQIRGETLLPQSDVYGLGLLGYEMLTLHGPFGASEIADVASAHIRRPPIDLHEANPEIPAHLSDQLKRCVSKKPEHRPTAASLASSLVGPIGSAATDAQEDTEIRDALETFLGELKKRKVYRSALAYATVVFVLLQVADLILPALGSPPWVYRTTVIVSLAAFPAALALAWVFDLRDGRLIRTDEVSSRYMQRISPRQLAALQALGLILSIAASAAVAWALLMS